MELQGLKLPDAISISNTAAAIFYPCSNVVVDHPVGSFSASCIAPAVEAFEGHPT